MQSFFPFSLLVLSTTALHGASGTKAETHYLCGQIKAWLCQKMYSESNYLFFSKCVWTKSHNKRAKLFYEQAVHLMPLFSINYISVGKSQRDKKEYNVGMIDQVDTLMSRIEKHYKCINQEESG